MKKTALFTTALISFASLFITTQVAFAQSPTLTGSSLTAIPPRLGEDLSLRIKPGEKIQTSVRVRNGSSEAMTVKSLAQDFIVDLSGETPIPIEGNVSNRWSLASWVILTPSVQEIQPGDIATINVIIDVPTDALPGGHYAMITHQPHSGSGASPEFEIARTSAATLTQRVGTLLYVTVDGPINEAAFIRELNFPKFTEYGPVPFSFTVDNQSDIHISPQIGVEIYNLFGKKVETIDMTTKNIFPFIARDFEGEWDRVWGFGPYTAKAIMSYGSTGQLAMTTTTFWLLPITLLMAILIIILIIIAVIIIIRRHLQHRRGDQQSQIEMLESKVSQLEQEKLKQFDN
jgi:hypothetical protein